MHSISRYMSDDHRQCDQLFVVAERHVAEQRWGDAGAAFAAFQQALVRHFAMEEDVLFPAFETAAGTAMGPTQVMRMEHLQMRELLTQLQHAAAARHGDEFLGAAETLLILMQQHNMKEEQILYPMTERTLAGGGAAVLEQLQTLHSAHAVA